MWHLINMSYCNSTYSNFTQSSLIQSWVLFGPLWIHNVKCTSVVIFSCVWCVCGRAAGIFVLSWQPPKGKTTRYETTLHLPPVPKLAGPPPSYSALPSLQSWWWLASIAVSRCYWIMKHFALKRESVCETEDRLNDCSRVQSCRFTAGALWST